MRKLSPTSTPTDSASFVRRWRTTSTVWSRAGNMTPGFSDSPRCGWRTLGSDQWMTWWRFVYKFSSFTIVWQKRCKNTSKKALNHRNFLAVVFVVVQRGVKQIPSYKFLPLMYQLAARMGTKMAAGPAGDVGFSDVLNDVISQKTNVMFWPLDFTAFI